MAFDVCGPTLHCAIGDHEEEVFYLPSEFNLPCPTLASLYERFYDDTVLDEQQISVLKDGLILVVERYLDDLVLRKTVLIDDPIPRIRTRSEIRGAFRLAVALDQLIRICDEALTQHATVTCHGD